MGESGNEWMGGENDDMTLREFADGDPDSQESKIVRVRSSLLPEISEDCAWGRTKQSAGRPELISNL